MTSTRFVFTLNNPTAEEAENLTKAIEDANVKYLVCGREVAPTTGTPHIQGFIILHESARFRAVKRLVGERAHIERARGTSVRCAEYCKKDGDFDEYGEFPGRQGARSDLDEFIEWSTAFGTQHGRAPTSPEIAREHPRIYLRYPRAVLLAAHRGPQRQLQFGEPNEWQQELVDNLDEEPDDRTVLFVVDPDGGKGKSWFCRWYLTQNPESTQVLGVGKKTDLAHMLDETKTIFLFNVGRGQMEFLSYSLLENLKDRMVMSGKYTSRMKIWTRNVHIVVLSNEPPDETKLTADRYVIRNI